MKPPLTPLEDWIKAKIGLSVGTPLTKSALEAYQLAKLRETIDYVRTRGPFYRDLLEGLSADGLTSLDDLARWPFTTSEDLREEGPRFLCVSQSEIARVVTLPEPEATSKPRRLYFTERDLELTIDFFHHGMSTLVSPGQRVLILMPGRTPGSVGDLLLQALSRMGVAAVVHGPFLDPAQTIEEIIKLEIDSLVGLPAQVLSLARHKSAGAMSPGRIKSVLLSADYVPEAVVTELFRIWGVRAFNHYGMTEMGLGGGVECRALNGYHLREADLYFEIIDPESGRGLPEGQTGEVVFSTLTREGLPLIRYRTGDLASFLPEPCPCGTILRRMRKVSGRLDGGVWLDQGCWLGIVELDEHVLAVTGLLGYQPELFRLRGVNQLKLTIWTDHGEKKDVPDQVREAVTKLSAVKEQVDKKRLILDIVTVNPGDRPDTGMKKRKIIDHGTMITIQSSGVESDAPSPRPSMLLK